MLGQVMFGQIGRLQPEARMFRLGRIGLQRVVNYSGLQFPRFHNFSSGCVGSCVRSMDIVLNVEEAIYFLVELLSSDHFGEYEFY